MITPPLLCTLEVTGVAQGVGFRPMAYRLANSLGLNGSIENLNGRVLIELRGSQVQISQFISNINEWLHTQSKAQNPPKVRELILAAPTPREFSGYPKGHPKEAYFEIKHDSKPSPSPLLPFQSISPDFAPCSECVNEFFDTRNRRAFFPMISCTKCGPRISVTHIPPFNRENTGYARFNLCTLCSSEYLNPSDRRFYAQTTSCPNCGPQYTVLESDRETYFQRSTEDSKKLFLSLASALKNNETLAIQGPTGFHLITLASNLVGIESIRKFKNRPHQPFAIMSPDVAKLERFCTISAQHRKWLEDPARPIVLCPLRSTSSLSLANSDPPFSIESVCGARIFTTIGAMLPPSGIYLGLFWAQNELFGDSELLVATSGNRSGSPLVFDRLKGLELFRPHLDKVICHNLPLKMGLDDSVLVPVDEDVTIWIRKSRGFFPYSMPLPKSIDLSIGSGAELKSTYAVGEQCLAVLSPTFGDLDEPETQLRLELSILENFGTQLQGTAQSGDFHTSLIPNLIEDLHPEFRSPEIAKSCLKKIQVTPKSHLVQHHFAHFLAALSEAAIIPSKSLGVIWDGTGLGTDQSIWGGEFFSQDSHVIKRVGRLLPFRLIGGDRAAKEPRRVAVSLEILSGLCPSDSSIFQLLKLHSQDQVSPWSSSVGRLFDGIASLLGLVHLNTYEAHAAQHLEEAAKRFHLGSLPIASYKPLFLWRELSHGPKGGAFYELDWRPFVIQLCTERNLHLRVNPQLDLLWQQSWAHRFHLELAFSIGGLLNVVGKSPLIQDIFVSGGCFQNSHLVQETKRAMMAFPDQKVHFHKILSPNDSSLAMGQLLAPQFLLV